MVEYYQFFILNQGVRTSTIDLCAHSSPCQNNGKCLSTDQVNVSFFQLEKSFRWMFLDYIDYYHYIDYIECFLMPNFFSTWEMVQGPVCDCAGLAFEGVFCDQGELDDESWMTKTKCWENIGQHQSHRVHCDQVIDLNLTSCSSSWLFLLSRTVAIRVRK